ncbi:MAG: hypothetical protein L0215_14850 [Gemmataceae bacterium]|nr:hypothetical protein [Gemmataceae bacterium]
MPSRLTVLLIALFWLATTSWLVVREMVPRWLAGDAPKIAFDITDEIAVNTAKWQIWMKGEPAGNCQTSVKRLPDRTFELRSELKFDSPVIARQFPVKKITNQYRVTKDGEFLEIGTKIYANPDALQKGLQVPDLESEISGPVEQGLWKAKLFALGQELIPLQPIKLKDRQRFLNPMQVFSKLQGLFAGQRWMEPLFDPIAAGLPVPSSITELDAIAEREVLVWHGQEFACFRINYSEPGKKVSASTWVRSRDGLVLQQEAFHQGMDLTLVREVK